MNAAAERRGILFLCVANSARSQMAEALARSLAPADLPIHSAGSQPTRIHPHALRVLAEADLDTTGQRSKAVDEVPMEQIACVVTLCAEEVCPVVPGEVRRLHWPHPDPASVNGTEEESLASFRTVRDALAVRIAAFLDDASLWARGGD